MSRIRLPPTSASSDRFMDFFEGSEVHGTEVIEALIARNRYGRLVTESLIEYANLRSELERDHAKGLEKLASFEFPKLEPIMDKALKGFGTLKNGAGQTGSSIQLGAVLVGVQRETKALAQTHKAYAKKIETEILEAFQRSYNNQVGTKMKHKARLFGAAEQIQEGNKKIVEARKASFKFLQRQTEAEGKLACSPDNDKLRSEVERARNAVTTAEQKIRDSESALESKQRSLQDGIKQAAKDIYDSEIARIHLTMEKLDQMCGLMNKHGEAWNKFTEGIMMELAHVNAGQEMNEFAVKYISLLTKRTGQTPPAAHAQQANSAPASRPYAQQSPTPQAQKVGGSRFVIRAEEEDQSVPSYGYESSHSSQASHKQPTRQLSFSQAQKAIEMPGRPAISYTNRLMLKGARAMDENQMVPHYYYDAVDDDYGDGPTIEEIE